MQFTTANGPLEVEIDQLIIAGWTGRDHAAVEHHIEELAALGVARPSQVPLFYRVSRGLLTTDSQIETLGATSSGEAEPMVLRHGSKLWLGLASDHTDRELEAVSVAASKQICAKPCAETLWAFEDVAPHLDMLRLRSWVFEDDDWVTYQEGPLAQIIPLAELIAASGLRDGGALLCGTLPAIGGVRPGTMFRATLLDPVLAREIALEYSAQPLPVIS